MNPLIFLVALFLTFGDFIQAASTAREITEFQKLQGEELFYRGIGGDYNQYAYEAEIKKDKWKARKESTNCFPWKGICKGMEKKSKKQQEANAKKGEEYIDKAHKFSNELDKRRSNHRQHKVLLQRVQEERPKATSFLILSNNITCTSREVAKDLDHHHVQQKHNILGEIYEGFADKAEREKMEWRTRKDNTKNCLFKEHCESQEKKYERKQVANAQKSRLEKLKANKVVLNHEGKKKQLEEKKRVHQGPSN